MDSLPQVEGLYSPGFERAMILPVEWSLRPEHKVQSKFEAFDNLYLPFDSLGQDLLRHTHTPPQIAAKLDQYCCLKENAELARF